MSKLILIDMSIVLTIIIFLNSLEIFYNNYDIIKLYIYFELLYLLLSQSFIFYSIIYSTAFFSTMFFYIIALTILKSVIRVIFIISYIRIYNTHLL